MIMLSNLLCFHVAPGTIPPPNVPTMEDVTAMSAVVGWSPPPDANGVIISYTVNFVILGLVTGPSGSAGRRRRQVGNSVMDCVVGGGNNIDRNVIVAGDQTSTTLANLSELES